jgi:hypothetical protein
MAPKPAVTRLPSPTAVLDEEYRAEQLPLTAIV